MPSASLPISRRSSPSEPGRRPERFHRVQHARERRLDAIHFTIDTRLLAGADRLGEPWQRLSLVQRVDVPAVDDVTIPALLRRLAFVQERLFEPYEAVVERPRALRGERAISEAVVDHPLHRV